MKELRTFRAELRAETTAGKRFLTGLAAPYNQLSEDLGGWRERIKPGTFSRALREQQDVRHLIDHSSSLVLGRTSAGTTTLWEDSSGLRFRTELADRSYETDLVTSIQRGDVNQSSFAFTNRVTPKWTEERDAKGNRTRVRELVDVDLYDISVVTYPAYPGTITEARDFAEDIRRTIFNQPVALAKARALALRVKILTLPAKRTQIK